MLFVSYDNSIPTYSQHSKNLLARRWHAYKFILLGIHNEAENKIALELIERLMDISNSKHENDKDTWLLNQLADVIQKFEKKMYG